MRIDSRQVQGSATIYQFPTAEQRQAAAYHTDSTPITDRLPRNVPYIVYGECWYHDAAIDESAGEHPHPL